MQGELSITPQVLKTTSTSFGQSNRTVNSTMSTMMQKVTSLRSAFEGDAASAYIQQFSRLQEDMNQVNKKIAEHVQDLQEMATNYEKSESKNVQANRSLKTDYI